MCGKRVVCGVGGRGGATGCFIGSSSLAQWCHVTLTWQQVMSVDTRK